MNEVAQLINEQSDLIWTLSLLILGVELFVFVRFLAPSNGETLGFGSWILLCLSLFALLVSLTGGYFTKGAVIELVYAAFNGQPITKLYEAAQIASFAQLSGFLASVLLFVVLVLANTRLVAKYIREKI